jgi:protein-S-isoprenylcysteine O-methyltransferase Ste14
MDDLRKGKVLVALQFGFILGIGVASGPDVFGRAELPNSIGTVLFGLGVVVMIAGVRGLGDAATVNPVPRSEAKLVEDGIYKYVRHPIYTGLLTLTLGLCISSGIVSKFVFWILLAGLLAYKIRWEETLLLAKFSGYAKYQKRVPAILPRLGNGS